MMALTAISSALLPTNSLLADDTEIFFSNNTENIVQPNVMFVLDTSGSMNFFDADQPDNRITIMKRALKNMIETSDNTNIGLMRFRDKQNQSGGGTVVYPIKDINSVVAGTTTIGDTTALISDDAVEDNSSKQPELFGLKLGMAGVPAIIEDILKKHTNLPKNCKRSRDRECRPRYPISYNDAIENVDTGAAAWLLPEPVYIRTNRWSTSYWTEPKRSYEIPKANGTGASQLLGLRFNNIDLDSSAIITRAYIEFTVDNQSVNGADNPVTFNIDVTDEAGSDRYTNNNRDISARNSLARIEWIENTLNAEKFDKIRSADISQLINSRLSSNWSAGNDLNFVISPNSGSGNRSFYSADYNNSNQPRLVIEYSGSGVADQKVGLRFDNVQVPQGATITDAFIEFTSVDEQSLLNENSGYARLNIYAHPTDDSGAFTTSLSDLSDRIVGASSEQWDAEEWTLPNTIYQSTDIKDIIESVTDRNGWCGGNSLSLIITGDSANVGSRLAKSIDAGAETAPRLRITYDPNSIPTGATQGCIERTFTSKISRQSNDAEEIISSGQIILQSDDLELVEDGINDQLVGLRFENLLIPRNSAVTDAYITFTADRDSSAATNLVIKGNDRSNATIFTTANKNISNRTSTSAEVSWNNIESWDSGKSYNTPALTNIVQEIINRGGWNTGNSMAFILSGSGTRSAHSASDLGNAPRLVVKAKTYGQPVLQSKTVRDELITTVNDQFSSAGSTPIVDALYEATLYFRGAPVDYGRNRGSTNDRRTTDRVAHPDSYTGGRYNKSNNCPGWGITSNSCRYEYIDRNPVYKTPVQDECQKTNHLVLLTDGDPTRNNSATKVRNLIRNGKNPIANCENPSTGDDGLCGEELTDWIFNNDQNPDLPGDQIIKTYVIGFGNSDVDESWLKTLATDSDKNEGYYQATSAEELQDAFDDILDDALEQDSSFVSPGIAVNNFNQLTHIDQLYFAMFKPTTAPRWQGNLKRYRLANNGNLVDINQNDAINPDNGEFDINAKSWWSPVVDGNNVAEGGAASLLVSTQRNLFTQAEGGENLVTFNKNNVSKTRLGIENKDDSDYDNLIRWTKGEDVNNEFPDSSERKYMADPIHSTPTLVTYGGNATTPNLAIFYGDNQGFLHAIDSETGKEHFAFIPEELLPNLNITYENQENIAHPYGLDGEVNFLVENGDDGKIDAAGDFVYAYIGMRRGGRNIYAINATDLNSPKRLWSKTIKGGSGDFEELGFTWSKPISVKMRVKGTPTDVLLFAGGYDEQQDNVSIKTPDNMGRAIYIVDAKTGEKLWSGGGELAAGTFDIRFTDMNYSIPSNIRAIDVTGDGLVNQFYVGDMGGQLWRFDVDQSASTGAKMINGGVIADLSVTADDENGTNGKNNRRFYYAPDISVSNEGNRRYLSIAIGSGYRAHPLDRAIEDRIYMIKQYDVLSAPFDNDEDGKPDYKKATEKTLFDTTDNLIGDGTDVQKIEAAEALKDADGWYIKLPNVGEKVLASTFTSGGVLYVTTFEPSTSVVGCKPTTGTSRLYRLIKDNGTPANTSGSSNGGGDFYDRYDIINVQGIAPPPIKIKPECPPGVDCNPVICVAGTCFEDTNNNATQRTYWIEQGQ